MVIDSSQLPVSKSNTCAYLDCQKKKTPKIGAVAGVIAPLAMCLLCKPEDLKFNH